MLTFANVQVFENYIIIIAMKNTKKMQIYENKRKLHHALVYYGSVCMFAPRCVVFFHKLTLLPTGLA